MLCASIFGMRPGPFLCALGLQPGPRAESNLVHSPSDSSEDDALIDRYVGGDESALREIVEHHRGWLHALAYQMLGNHTDADDVVQDTFIHASRGLADFRRECSLRTWLHCIAANGARSLYHSAGHRRRMAAVPYEEATCACTSDPARSAQQQEFAERIELCLRQLEDAHRSILNLWINEDRRYSEIRSDSKVCMGTVGSRLARARRALRLKLAAHFPEHAPRSKG